MEEERWRRRATGRDGPGAGALSIGAGSAGAISGFWSDGPGATDDQRRGAASVEVDGLDSPALQHQLGELGQSHMLITGPGAEDDEYEELANDAASARGQPPGTACSCTDQPSEVSPRQRLRS